MLDASQKEVRVDRSGNAPSMDLQELHGRLLGAKIPRHCHHRHPQALAQQVPEIRNPQRSDRPRQIERYVRGSEYPHRQTKERHEVYVGGLHGADTGDPSQGCNVLDQ